MSEPISFHFDYLSPYAYLAWTQLHALAAQDGRDVLPVPTLLAALLDHSGSRGPAEIPAKRVYIFKDALRSARVLGLPLAPPPRHPFNPLLALLSLAPAPAAAGPDPTDATAGAQTRDGSFLIRGVTGHVRHLHGGPAAQIGSASFLFANRSDKPRTVAVRAIEFLHGVKDCENPPQRVVSRPKPAGILLQDAKQQSSAPRVEVAAGVSVPAVVGFAEVPAYYVFCDRFAVRVRFEVDGEPVVATDEIKVLRVEPLRQPGG